MNPNQEPKNEPRNSLGVAYRSLQQYTEERKKKLEQIEELQKELEAEKDSLEQIKKLISEI